MAKNKTAQVAHHSSIRSQSRDKRRKVDAISSEVLDDDDDHHLHDEDQDEDEDDNGLKEDDSTTATREREDSTTSTGIKIDQLGFEILDIIFSFFSTSSTKGFGGGASSNNSNNNNNNLASSNLQQQQDAGTLSHYENQLNLLNFCQVSKGFYVVARLHLSRFIPIASTFKARQVLSLCSSSSASSSLSSTTSAIVSNSKVSTTTTTTDDTFGSRVHSLLLHWPDQGKYSTRRSSVITHDEFILLLSSFPSLRALELVHLPYTSLELPPPPTTTTSSSSFSTSLNYATLASMGVLDNLRSLNLNGSPYNLRNEEFDIVIELLSLFKRLENLDILNVPLNSVIKLTELPSPPLFTLKSLSIKISSPRRIDSNILEWMLENTIKNKSCTSLTIWLSKKCTDLYREFNPAIKSVKEDEGFKDLQIPLAKLSPSLRYISLLGLRKGQSQAILENTSNRLERLTLFDTFGFGDNILDYLPIENGLKELEMLANPSIAFGKMPTTLEELTPSTTTLSRGRHHNLGNTARNSMASSSSNTNGNGQSMNAQASTSASGVIPASTPSAPGSASASVSATTTNSADSAAAAATIATTTEDTTTTNNNTATTNNNNAHPTSFIEIPISSHSFISELGPNNKLSNLKVVRIPENARFARRGRWLNKELIKACKRAGVDIEEIPAVNYAS